MGKIIYISGGARSGKSSFALTLASRMAGRTAFVATCEPLDKEMKKRIGAHKKSRPREWETFEAPLCVSLVLKNIKDAFGVVIIDCITLLVSNLLLKGHTEAFIEEEVRSMCRYLKKERVCGIIVSNEVGLGIVPENELARAFRDIAGRVNQVIAEESDEAFFMVSGLPLKVK